MTSNKEGLTYERTHRRLLLHRLLIYEVENVVVGSHSLASRVTSLSGSVLTRDEGGSRGKYSIEGRNLPRLEYQGAGVGRFLLVKG